jgi:ankyrin repeat protein
MKKQIDLLLVAVALILSNGSQASSLSSTRRAFTPLFRQAGQAVYQGNRRLSPDLVNAAARRYATQSRGGGLMNYTKQQPMKQFAMPTARAFTNAPIIAASADDSYWKQFNNSIFAKWIASLFAGTLVGGYAMAEESEPKPKEGIFERWFGKPRGYSAGQLQENLSKALADAVESKSIDRVRDLIAKGADVNAKTTRDPDYYDFQSPLIMSAVIKGDADIVKELIQAGADINAKTKNGKTPLMFAISADIVKELIQAGADINAKTKNGETVLMLAVIKGDADIVKELIQAGADINAETNDPKYGFQRPFMSAVIRGNADVVKEFIQAGVDVNAKMFCDPGHHFLRSPLMLAVIKGYADIVKELIQAGADVNAETNDGETVLMLAVSEGYASVVKELMQAGADVNAKTKNGKTVLDMAQELYCNYPYYGRKEIVELLKSHGAKNIQIQ